FPFTKTHTWLVIHRLNYRIDSDWKLGAEFRQLTQQEARDVKRGFLLELARSMGPHAELGVGYNFTAFNDDLTALSYAAQGPFVRMTGKVFDRTPDEIARSRQKWLNDRIHAWAWEMIDQELSKPNSPILSELNEMFAMAQVAANNQDYEKSHNIYRDIITASQMMLEEAVAYIRGQVSKEEQLKQMKAQADQYFKNGEYEKARKILEKIVEDAENGVIE
ncbi:MAG: hypothetical protein HQL23_09520, partial [Candidatus Omnitrophica bacterium]|nr:hypothetical protein [Candidatus Omnitrophota bacterium]